MKDEHKLLSELGAAGPGPGAHNGYYDAHGFGGGGAGGGPGGAPGGGAPAGADLYDSLQPGLQQQPPYTNSLAASLGTLFCIKVF